MEFLAPDRATIYSFVEALPPAMTEMLKRTIDATRSGAFMPRRVETISDAPLSREAERLIASIESGLRSRTERLKNAPFVYGY